MAQKIVPDFESYKKMDHQSSSWVGHLNTILASTEEKGVGILSNQSSKVQMPRGLPERMLKLWDDRHITCSNDHLLTPV